MYRIGKRLKTNRRHVFDVATLGLMGVAFLALAGLIFYQIRPVKTLDVEVPVLLDKSNYKPGDTVTGTFFGEVFYTGEVKVFRELACKGTQIALEDGNELNSFFNGVSIPRKLEGEDIVIGKIPNNAPRGARCLIEMVNTYQINTPFGNRHEVKRYYTLSFIINAEPATPQEGNDEPNTDGVPNTQQGAGGQSFLAPPQQGANTLQPQSPQQPTNQPDVLRHIPPEVLNTPSCVIDLLGIKLLCR